MKEKMIALWNGDDLIGTCTFGQAAEIIGCERKELYNAKEGSYGIRGVYFITENAEEKPEPRKKPTSLVEYEVWDGDTLYMIGTAGKIGKHFGQEGKTISERWKKCYLLDHRYRVQRVGETKEEWEKRRAGRQAEQRKNHKKEKCMNKSQRRAIEVAKRREKLAEICREAKAHGMSYGDYVAFKEGGGQSTMWIVLLIASLLVLWYWITGSGGPKWRV